MRIGIITQPLQANYGGFIQNWALQQVLKKLGHEPITIDAFPPDSTIRKWIKDNIYSLKAFLIKGKPLKYVHYYKHRSALFDDFVEKNINTTKSVHVYSESLIDEYNFEGLLVGSDQVWRPMYNRGCLEDMFLKFAESFESKKVAYAASFGADEWEYTPQQTQECKRLIRYFDAISVREPSAVDLCKEHFGVEAEQLLDPTLLLEKEDYIELIKDTKPVHQGRFLASYIIDISPELEKRGRNKAKELNLEHFIITPDGGAKMTVEQWISIFRDAEFIFTNSFHGSLFSLIFNKPFEYIANGQRGGARFKLIQNLIDNRDIAVKKQQSIQFLTDVFRKCRK